MATFDGADLKTYINDVNDKTDNTSGTLEANPQDLVIGGQCDSINNLHGQLQHIGILNRCLTQEEISELTEIIF